MFACPSVWNNSAPTGQIFMKFDIWIFFEKYVEKIQVPLKSDKNKGYFTEYQCIFSIISRSAIRRMRNVLGKNCRNNKNTHFIFNTPRRKTCRLWYNVENYFIAGQATDDNMVHAHWILDTLGCKHTLMICNNYCISKANMLTQKGVNFIISSSVSLINTKKNDRNNYSRLRINVMKSKQCCKMLFKLLSF
jgi:hypothetical protein